MEEKMIAWRGRKLSRQLTVIGVAGLIGWMLTACTIEVRPSLPDAQPATESNADFTLKEVPLQILPEKCLLSDCVSCTCYWSSDCTSGSCNYSSGCTQSGKNDGTCKVTTGSVIKPDVLLAAEAIETMFEGYIVAGQTRDGLPDEGLNGQARRLNSVLTPLQYGEIQETVFNAIDITMGFDFVHPRGDCVAYDARCLGQFIIQLDARGVALLRATQSGFTRALTSNDRGVLAESLQSFWQENTDFAPHHMGRCYPHGHAEFPYASPLECQVDELGRLLDTFLPASE
jgi:hypothetical protein